MRLRIMNSIFILLITLSSTGCASFVLDKKLRRDDIALSSIEISGLNRYYYSITLGKKPDKNIIFYFTGTGCHDPSFNASLLFDNSNLNATVFILLKNGVIFNDFGRKCSLEYIENDNRPLS